MNESHEIWKREDAHRRGERRSALLVVCNLADDAHDAAFLLDVLGLNPYTDVAQPEEQGENNAAVATETPIPNGRRSLSTVDPGGTTKPRRRRNHTVG